MKLLPITSNSLRQHPAGPAIGRILQAALTAADPFRAVQQYFRRDGPILEVQGRNYDLDAFLHVYLVGAGKAGYPMASAVEEVLAERLTAGIVIVKDGHLPEGLPTQAKTSFIEAGHPIPDLRGVEGTRQIISLLQGAGADDLVVCVISGGGSALLTAPTAPVTLDDLQKLTAELLACGASIQEINTIRKHLDAVKGGGLARLASPARLIVLILSDVIGDPLDAIASGPAVADLSTFEDALGIIVGYDIGQKVPPAILDRLQRGCAGEIAETPKAGDPIFDNVQTVLAAGNRLALQAAVRQAEAEGFQAAVIADGLQGEARKAGDWIVAQIEDAIRQQRPGEPPVCLIAGGETTVTLHGNGQGGRNQELALSMVDGLAGLRDVVIAALASDGGDGPTDAAGAVVTNRSARLAAELGLDARAFLKNNDAYHFFEPLGDLLVTGPTQTNVNDLAVAWIGPKA